MGASVDLVGCLCLPIALQMESPLLLQDGQSHGEHDARQHRFIAVAILTETSCPEPPGFIAAQAWSDLFEEVKL